MNIVFMGTPDFAEKSLKKIHESGHNILAVVTQPDRPSGRGMKLQKSPVKEYAESAGIKVYQPIKIRKDPEFIDEMKGLKPDVIVVVAFGQILPQSILDIPKYGCINVHGSLLPKYRGAAPIQWAIINGEKVTGITTMYMDAGMDTGDMILKEQISIEDDDTFGTVHDKMRDLGAKLIVQTLEKIADEMVPREKQPDECTLAPMITKEVCKIDWGKSANEIRNLVRGLNPIPGAYTTYNGGVVKVWDVTIIDEKSEEIPGTVLVADDKRGMEIATNDGIIKVNEIQMTNCKRMKTCDCLRGKKLEVGSILM